MTTVRYRRRQTFGEDGKKLCKVCDKSLPKGRSSYCSDECWHRNTPGIMRSMVERRDKGICAICGLQCRCRGMGIDWSEYRKLPQWQADHITPVVEGGGLCGLDGYRTLCMACHKVETKALAARRAEQKRFSKQPLLGDL